MCEVHEKRFDHRDNVNCILSDSSAAGLSFYSIKWRNTTLFYPRIKIHVSTSPYIVPLIAIYTSCKNLESYHCICSRWRSCLFSSLGQFFFLHKGEITVVKQYYLVSITSPCSGKERRRPYKREQGKSSLNIILLRKNKQIKPTKNSFFTLNCYFNKLTYLILSFLKLNSWFFSPPGTIRRLLTWIKDNLLKQRPELFIQGESV